MPRQPRIPSYRKHKATGQAVVSLGGRDVYLGRHGSPESQQRYERLIAEWLAAGRQTPPERRPDLTVDELLAGYLGHASLYYLGAEGRPTAQLDRVKRSLAPATQLYGPTRARLFGPAALRACRDWMVRQGWCRRVVNQRVGCLVRAFKWAVAEELVPPAVWQALKTVEGLKAGRTEAPEPAPVKPVPEPAIAAVKGLVLPVLADVIELQLATAMRPGEVLALRPGDLDRSREVWLYRLERHKTRWRGQHRTVLIGPRGQKLLAPYLDRPQDAYCFSPREALEALRRQRGQKERFGRDRVPGDRYLVTSYSHAVRLACKKADQRARQEAIAAGMGREDAAGRVFVESWHPHQLRHSAATRLADEFGIELARIILGHRHLDTTRLYAEDNLRKAMDAMRQVG